jgi:hydroxycarboxylate dehydrogenase B
MAEMHTVPAETLEQLAARIFVAAGVQEDHAAHVARHLVKANLSGHDSHGVIRIPAYLQQIKNGRIDVTTRPEVVQERAGTAVVDGKKGFGQVAASFALDVAIRKAGETGVGAVSVRRCNHIGRLGDYSETAGERGYIAFVTFGTAGANSGHSAPFGGAQRHFATTVVAEGKIQVARAKHAQLPPGSIVDKDGNPSTEPNDFYAGGMILPFGGHKGYGLSLVAALLGAGLTAEEPSEDGKGGGVFVMAIDPRAFADEAAYTGTVDAMAASVRSVPPAPGFQNVLLPGEPEANSRAQRSKEGVPVPADTWDAIAGAASEVGVEMPALAGASS